MRKSQMCIRDRPHLVDEGFHEDDGHDWEQFAVFFNRIYLEDDEPLAEQVDVLREMCIRDRNIDVLLFLLFSMFIVLRFLDGCFSVFSLSVAGLSLIHISPPPKNNDPIYSLRKFYLRIF